MKNIETKKQIRNHYKAKRSSMPPGLADRLSAQISKLILQWEPYQQAESLFFYYPLGNEVSLLPVIKDALAQGRPVAFPKVTGDDMLFYEVKSLRELKEGHFHVMEPRTGGRQPVHWARALCFVPGVVFDRTGGRFGYGRGYYDRYFSGYPVWKLVGCAYGCQITDRLPTDAWDKRMDHLASEDGIVPCQKQRRMLHKGFRK